MNPFRTIWSKFRSLGRQQSVKREIDEELRFHIEQRTAENIAAGMTPDEAAREARKRFGNFQSVREECRERRGASLGETTWQDIRFGARVLRKNPGFTLTVLSTLAVAIGAITVIYSLLYAIVLRPLPYDSPDRIMRIGSGDRRYSGYFGSISLTDFAEWNDHNPVFSELAFYRPQSATLTGTDGEARRLSYTKVSWNFFDAFAMKPALGRTFLQEEDVPGRGSVVVVNYKFWKEELGGRVDAAGRQVQLDNRNYTVIGVMPPAFAFPEQSEVWIPAAEASTWFTSRRHDFFHHGIGRLAPGVSQAQAQAAMNVLAERQEKEHPATNLNRTVRLVRLQDSLVQNIRPILMLLFGAVGLVLLIACANIANLLLARAVTREREMVVRAALGAGRKRIIRQLLTESVLLSLLGGALGTAFAYGGVHLVRVSALSWIPRLQEVTLNLPVLGFALGISVLTGVLFGIVPALHSYVKDLSEALKGRGVAGASRTFARSGLVVSEVALSIVLLVGAGLLVNSFMRLQAVDSGLDEDKVLCVALPAPPESRSKEQGVMFYQRLMEHIASLDPHSEVAFSRFEPFAQGISYWFAPEGRESDIISQNPTAVMNMVSRNYFQILGIQLLRGRLFDVAEPEAGMKVVVVNQTLAQRWFPDEDPVGKRLLLETIPQPVTIIGVVSDTRQWSLAVAPQPAIYLERRQFAPTENILLVRVKSSVAQAEKMIREAVKRTDANAPISRIRTVKQIIDQSIAQQRLQTLLLTSLAIVAVSLASLGIYGVLAYIVRQRTREIGIRMALGAQRADVLWLVLRHGLKLASIGIVLGLIAALGLTRVLANLLFEVKPTDPLTFGGVAILLLAIALLACWLPARRAAKVEPMVALRYE